MNVGIVTLYKVRNYGACLQAYAMQQILCEQGHEVYFLKSYDNKFANELLHNDLGQVRPWYIPYLLAKEIKYRQFFKRFQELDMNQLRKLDCVLIGSDSVWKDRYGKMRMPSAFFGAFEHNAISSYAPSVGGTYSISNYSAEQREGLKKLKHITVRDEMSLKFIKEVAGRDASLVVDPTLLVDWENILEREHIKNKQNYGRYILLYGGFDLKLINVIKRYAALNDLQIVNVGGFNWRFPNNPVVNPLEFVRLIQNSEVVLTSMFHGVMLSIALKKNFRYLALDPQRGIKISTIIEQLELNECIISKQDFIINPNIITLGILQKKTAELLNVRRRKSIAELNKCLLTVEDLK